MFSVAGCDVITGEEDPGEATKARTNPFDKFDFVTLSYAIQSAKPDTRHCCRAGKGFFWTKSGGASENGK